MSKSDSNRNATVYLLDDIDQVAKKIQRAVTDSGDEIVYREDKPALSNLLAILSSVSGISISELEQKYRNSSYKQFKDDISTSVSEFLQPLQEKYHEIRQDEKFLSSVLDEGAQYARSQSKVKVKQVVDAVGLGRSS